MTKRDPEAQFPISARLQLSPPLVVLPRLALPIPALQLSHRPPLESTVLPRATTSDVSSHTAINLGCHTRAVPSMLSPARPAPFPGSRRSLVSKMESGRDGVNQYHLAPSTSCKPGDWLGENMTFYETTKHRA